MRGFNLEALMRHLLPFTAIAVLAFAATTLAAPAKPQHAWAAGQI
jgi:hypothetical protein